MKLLVLILNRVFWFFPTVLGLMVLTFTISHVIPADPVAFVAGDNATNEQIEALRRQLGLDQPMHVQLGRFITGVVRGDLGESLYTLRPISEDLAGRLPATLELTMVAVLLSTVIGIPASGGAAVGAMSWSVIAAIARPPSAPSRASRAASLRPIMPAAPMMRTRMQSSPCYSAGFVFFRSW